jgi:hypothetical protein
VDRVHGERRAAIEPFERDRNDLARRREQRRRVEGHARVVPRVAHPGRPHLAGELTVTLLAREDEHLAAEVSGDREDEVCRRTESEEPEPRASPRAGEPQRSIADHSGTEKRRGLPRREPRRQAVRRSGGSGHPLGVAAVPVAAREPRPPAEVLAAGRAERALAARLREPSDADAIADPKIARSGAWTDDPTGDLVARDDRQRRGDLSLDDVEVRPADAAGVDLDDDLALNGSRVRQIRGAERTRFGRGRPLEDHSVHAALFCSEVDNA